MSQRQDPFYQPHYAHSVASTTNVQPNPAPAQHLTMITQINEQSLQAIRKLVREAVHRELHPDPLSGEPLHPIINYSHVGVEVAFTDFDGQEYRGVLYPVKVDK